MSERLPCLSVPPSLFPAGPAQSPAPRAPGGGHLTLHGTAVCPWLGAVSSQQLTSCTDVMGLPTSRGMSPTGSFEPLVSLTGEVPKLRLGRGLDW